MTIFHCEGFETIGNLLTSATDLEARLNAMQLSSTYETGGGLTDDVALMDDFLPQGKALRLPLGQTSRGWWMRSVWPSAYQVTTNASHPTAVVGFRYFNADVGNEVTFWSHMISAFSFHANLRAASGAEDLVLVDITGTQTITGVLTPDEWHYIEIHYKPVRETAGGFITIYVDGNQVYSATRNVGNSSVTTYGTRFGAQYSGNTVNGKRPAIDDIYQLIIDGDHAGPLGPSRVLLLSPDTDATPNDWTPSTGSSNFALIDEVTWDETDYVGADATGEDDHYGLTTLGAVDDVHVLQVDVVCEAVDGTPNLHVGFDNGTADEADVGTVPTGSTSHFREYFETDPSGAPWSVANVNSVELTQRMTE